MTPVEGEKLNTPLRVVINEKNLFSELLPFDEYHLVMAQSDVIADMQSMPAIKTYFYRTPPFGNSYIIFAGLSSLLNKLDNFDYKKILPYLKEKGYDKRFIDYLQTRSKLKIKIHSLPENSPAFPNEPIVVIETILVDARIIEGIVLAELNFASLCATKWHRIKNTTAGRPVMEFGRRRAQNSLKASLYSYMAGVDSTSNCEANDIFGIPSSGTMGHEYVQSFSSELEAFDKWLEYNPTRPCLLLDTLSTFESGLPNAVTAFKKHKEKLIKLGFWDKISFRIDSGDLAYLGLTSYNKMVKELGTANIGIVLSNDLDEHSVASILLQFTAAGATSVIERLAFGIGTKGVTGWDEPALGGVCKLSELDGNYILKISNNIDKTTLPGNLRSALIIDGDGQYVTTLIYFHNEDVSAVNKFMHFYDDTKFIPNGGGFSTISPRQQQVYFSDGISGNFIGECPSLSLKAIRAYGKTDLDTLDWSYKRAVNSHIAKVSLSPKVFEVRKAMVRERLMLKPE